MFRFKDTLQHAADYSFKRTKSQKRDPDLFVHRIDLIKMQIEENIINN